MGFGQFFCNRNKLIKNSGHPLCLWKPCIHIDKRHIRFSVILHWTKISSIPLKYQAMTGIFKPSVVKIQYELKEKRILVSIVIDKLYIQVYL